MDLPQMTQDILTLTAAVVVVDVIRGVVSNLESANIAKNILLRILIAALVLIVIVVIIQYIGVKRNINRLAIAGASVVSGI